MPLDWCGGRMSFWEDDICLTKLDRGHLCSSGCSLVCFVSFFFLKSPLKLQLYFHLWVQGVRLPFIMPWLSKNSDGGREGGLLICRIVFCFVFFCPNSILSCTVSCWNKCESLSLLSHEISCVCQVFMTEWQEIIIYFRPCHLLLLYLW